MTTQRRNAVFLDKDGTLIEDVPYNVDPDLLRLTPGAAEAARRLHEAGYQLVVITNQSGVARGLFPESALGPVRERLQQLLGVPILDFYYCPHHPEGSVEAYAVECECRKPRSGMLERAAREHHLDLTASWMIGDILNDVEAGNRAGCRSMLVLTGGETEWLSGPYRAPAAVVPDLGHAADVILNHNPTREKKEVHRAEHAAPHH